MELDYLNVHGCKAFIAAILDQAFSDAISRRSSDNSESARRFLNKDNSLFRHYCHLLDLEPDYVHRKMVEAIKVGKFKRLSKLRK